MNRYIQRTVDFEEDVASIRAVSAYPGDDFTAKIQFFNEDDVLEHEYHPYSQYFHDKENVKHLLADNQELIGVYGVQGHETFSSFGFIYKQKKLANK